jgi:hypothetical protein
VKRPSHIRVLAAVVATFLAGAAAMAQDPPPQPGLDPRVETALKQAGLDYMADDGDFRLTYNVGEGRTQLVWVASKTARITSLEFRDVWSIAARGKGNVPEDLARKLLTENVRMVVGAWQVSQGPEDYLVVFSAPIAADASATALQEIIEAVTLSADRMEKQLGTEDRF